MSISETATRGKILVADQSMHAGQTILVEKPVIIAHSPSLDYFDYYASFCSSPPPVQRDILDFYSPVEGPRAQQLRKVLPELFSARFGTAVDEQKLSEFVKVAMAFQFNSVGVNPAPEDGAAGEPVSLGSGLYKLACRAAHSCQPNCFWLSDSRGWRVLRTLVAVEQGQELTIDYELGRCSLMPVHERRARLLASKEFLCQCPRCAADGDDTRRFPCPTPTCKGSCLVHQPTSNAQAKLLPCSSCGQQVSTADSAHMLMNEAELIKEIARINFIIDTGRFVRVHQHVGSSYVVQRLACLI